MEKRTTSFPKTADLFLRNSICLNGYLHRYGIQHEWPDCVEEICDICGDRQFFRIVDGKIDTNEYISYHARQALPPFHPLYIHEYRK